MDDLKKLQKRRIIRDKAFGPVPAWWFAPWHRACSLMLYIGGTVGLAAWFDTGPLALLARFFPVVVQVVSAWLMLLAAIFGLVTYGVVMLYQRRITKLARRVRAAS
ncbi:MAG: hypothetical protein H0T47_23265 [Planctomycetaceae bacterium]|nr:hypothetical protein [Planctomycetaceae bacterium]